LGKELGPLAFQHGFQALPGNVPRTGAIEIVTDFLIVCGNSFGDGSGGAPYYKEPARDFLSGADFGERTKGGRVEVQSERFVVNVDFFRGRHNHAPVRKKVSLRSESMCNCLSNDGSNRHLCLS
jgi:hypothetical protein